MHMPTGMVLKSEPFASNISDPRHQHTVQQFRTARGEAYQPIGAPIPIGDFIDYADWFREQSIPDVKDVKATSIRKSPNGFEVVLDDGEVLATKRVILATGHLAYRYIPSQLGHLPRALVSHSADYRDLSGFAGKDVTVVGVGQSGLETAALMLEQGANVRVLARAPRIGWNADLNLARSMLDRMRNPESGLGPGWRNWVHSELPQVFAYLPVHVRERIVATANGPAGAWWLKRRMIGKCTMLTSSEIADAAERYGRLELTVRSGSESTQVVTDHVLAATGYKVNVGRLSYLDQALRSAIKAHNGAPVLNSVYESSVPGLHFVGISAALTFGPVMRFVHGTKHPAHALAAHIRSAVRQQPDDMALPLPARRPSSATFNPR